MKAAGSHWPKGMFLICSEEGISKSAEQAGRGVAIERVSFVTTQIAIEINRIEKGL